MPIHIQFFHQAILTCKVGQTDHQKCIQIINTTGLHQGINVT